MASSKKTPVRARSVAVPPATAPDARPRYRVLLWLIFLGGSLFFLPQCLDRYLISRFFFLSAVLLSACLWMWAPWRARGDWRLGVFDGLLLAWYGLNVASAAWAFSWSEGVFYAQKVLLLFGVYWFVRQALIADAALVRQTLAHIIGTLTLAVSVLLLIQVGIAFREFGLDNQHLYDYATGVFGNKGLAADFLFFLLILNILFRSEYKNDRLFWIQACVLGLLILVLQTRTVYLAVVVGALVYGPVRAALDPGFRRIFLQRLLPATVVGLGVLTALLSWKGRGTTLSERLNPATYLESATAVERRFVWAKTDELNQDHFWLGVGNGSWKIWFPSKSIHGAYRLQERNVVFTRAHNDYLEVRSEMGIVGVVVFLALFGAAFLAAAFAIRRHTDARSRHEVLVLCAGLAGYCVIQYFDFPRERIELQAILGLLFALLAHGSKAVWDRWPGLSIQRRSGVFLGLLATGLAFNLVIGWNRIAGEVHNLATLKAQAAGNWSSMHREAVQAHNAFYAYSDVTIPMPWFEGIALYQMNRVPEALTAFEEAYRLNPWAFQVINNYATVLVRSGKFREAIPLFEQAVAINPRYDEGKFNLSYAWYSLGDTLRAREWLNRVDTIPNPPSEVEWTKNRAILKQKADFEQALKQLPAAGAH